MSRKTKVWLIIAACLLLIGCLILGGAMTALQWDFIKLSTDNFETNAYTITDQFENISIITDTADIVFAPSGNGECSVVCYEQDNLKHSVAVKDGSLSIEVVDSRKWYEYIGIHFGSAKITVYLPQSQYHALSVRTDTGDVDIPQPFAFESIDISGHTGDVTNCATASGLIKIRTSTGKIHLENISANVLDLSVSTGDVTVANVICAGDLTVHVSTGRVTISATTCKNLISNGSTGDISLRDVIAEERFFIERSTGSVRFDCSDAAEIFVTTDTGNVTGTLLSSKQFTVRSDTGRVDVPQTQTGGKCGISTDTGNIRIDILTP